MEKHRTTCSICIYAFSFEQRNSTPLPPDAASSACKVLQSLCNVNKFRLPSHTISLWFAFEPTFRKQQPHLRCLLGLLSIAHFWHTSRRQSAHTTFCAPSIPKPSPQSKHWEGLLPRALRRMLSNLSTSFPIWKREKLKGFTGWFQNWVVWRSRKISSYLKWNVQFLQ